MTLGEIIELADRVSPNAFSAQDKTVWLNELEYTVQTDVFGQTEDLTEHVWSAVRKGTVTLTAAGKLLVPGPFRANPGGRITLSGASGWVSGTLTGVPVTAAEETEAGQLLTLASPPALTEDISGEADLFYDGSGETMLAPAAWHRIYYAWLEARIDAENGEWDEYANAAQVFNAFMGQFQRWYARTYIDEK